MGTKTSLNWGMPIIKTAIRDSFVKLTPQHQIRNPVMFTVYVSSLMTTALLIQALMGQGEVPTNFIFFNQSMAMVYPVNR